MKSKKTVLIESLEKAANLITPARAAGGASVPIACGRPAAFAELGYRLGRALSIARALQREGRSGATCR